MDLQPILKNEKVTIRPMQLEDAETLYKVAKDPLIWEQHPCKRNVRLEFDAFFKESIHSKGALVIFDNQTNTMIGSSRFKTFKDFPNVVEIGWTFLDCNHWGGTYNRIIKKLMIQHAFQYVDTIVLFVAKDNIRSQKAVEKINGRKINVSKHSKLPSTISDNLTYIIESQSQSDF